MRSARRWARAWLQVNNGPPGGWREVSVEFEVEFEVHLSGSEPPGSVYVDGAEPCELCGQQVLYASLAPLFETLVPPLVRAPTGLDVEQWLEVYVREDGVTLRGHTRKRCVLVRAGRPEPLSR